MFSGEGGNDVPRSLRGRTKEWWAFTPPHLEAEGDNNVDVVERSRRGGGWKDIAEVPCILVAHGHSPEAVFDVELAEFERMIGVEIGS